MLAYDGGEPVGWAAVAPRSDTSFARSRRIPHVDDLPVWSLWCIRVRPGHRKRGISHALIAGAVEFARAHGAPAIEAYPLDSGGAEVDVTMAYAGIRRNFERAGFVHAADTTSVLAGHPRVLEGEVGLELLGGEAFVRTAAPPCISCDGPAPAATSRPAGAVDALLRKSPGACPALDRSVAADPGGQVGGAGNPVGVMHPRSCTPATTRRRR
ncbi:hypothetical protein GCM10022224_055710 [Nonomuraea antimicrobica]|uniref:N-acetyltransferase domain-containing protein n=1 Tax=Nonomuraea antimicrobica TaxID=561173 RepID=A0ABP7CCE8_9ACTN